MANVPKLRIHTLTEGDIRTYATDFLKSTVLPSRNNTTYREREEFVEIVFERSNGVFLWVYLVLRRLRRGLTNNDTIAVLNDRLEQTPKELHNLFNDMWNRLGQDAELTDYMSTAATYFGLVTTAQSRRRWPLRRDRALLRQSESGGITVPDIMLATDRRFLQSVLDGCDIDPEQIEEKCEAVLTNLETRCAGFLECREVELPIVPRKHCSLASQTHYHKLRIQFIHRSALEYLLSTREGNQILVHDTSTARDRLALLCHVDLAIAKLWGFYSHNYGVHYGPRSCLTIGRLLDTLSTYARKDKDPSNSTKFWHPLLSLGGLIYTDARCMNEDPFSIYAGCDVSDFIGNKSPDYIMLVCSLDYGFGMDLLPTYLELLRSRLTPDYLGYLSLLICRVLAKPASKFGEFPYSEVNPERVIIGLQYLVEYGANLNIEGPPSLGMLGMDYNKYCFLETPVSVLILNLYRAESGISILFTLCMISMLLKSGAEINQTMVFSSILLLPFFDHAATPGSLVSGIISQGHYGESPRMSIVFTATPEYLLRLALSSFLHSKVSIASTDILESVVADLIDLKALSGNLVAPDPLAFTSRGSNPIDVESWGNRIIGSYTHKLLVQPLLVKLVKSFCRPSNEWDETHTDALHQLEKIAFHCELTTFDEIRSGLGTKYNSIRTSEYVTQIPQLGDENERILRDHLKKEAYNHRGG